MIFRTLTGSEYEYEASSPMGPRARRLVRSAASDAERPGQGEWRPCQGILGPRIGDNAIIHWDTDEWGNARCTVTSPVTDIQEPPCRG